MVSKHLKEYETLLAVRVFYTGWYIDLACSFFLNYLLELKTISTLSM